MNLKENQILRCPKCGAVRFNTTAHVAQDWEVDARGVFQKSLNDCVEVTHYPDEDDIFDCAECDYSDTGGAFIVTVNPATSYDRLCALLTDYEGNGSANKPGLEDLRAEVNLLLAEWSIIVGTLTDKAELKKREVICERLRLVKTAENKSQVYAALCAVANNWETLVTAHHI